MAQPLPVMLTLVIGSISLLICYGWLLLGEAMDEGDEPIAPPPKGSVAHVGTSYPDCA